MARKSLLDKFHIIKFDLPLTFRHGIWVAFGSFVCYSLFDMEKSLLKEMQTTFQSNYKDFALPYQAKYSKTFAGSIDSKGFPDNGEWLFTESLNIQAKEKMSLLTQQKKFIHTSYNLFLPFYIIAGFGFPLLSTISAIFWYKYSLHFQPATNNQTEDSPLYKKAFSKQNIAYNSIALLAIASSIKIISLL